ncbi:hypothetical protein BXU06_12890 [Aquaspirillum sp. LM1]|uniref:hypothetical protein n=1 Tax=Aquaspirillum sp. LM1 TaxID=1938604 RepID=UPI000983DF3D|nr:hypothetical protein [Aquaspirillum sp. LM1]AQR65850.1 hypothetical protein BXU06_12890 [Aquaspirillum sp. LM1]
MRQTPTAMPLVDALKAFACLTIVIHHLCFYGPLTDAVRPWLPGLIGFFDPVRGKPRRSGRGKIARTT